MASFSEFMPLERDTWADVMSSGDAHAIHDVRSMSLWVLSVSNADICAWHCGSECICTASPRLHGVASAGSAALLCWYNLIALAVVYACTHAACMRACVCMPACAFTRACTKPDAHAHTQTHARTHK